MEQPTTLVIVNDVLGWIGFILSLLLVCLYAIDDNYRRFPCSIYLYSLLSAAIVSFAIPLGSAVNHVNLDTTNGIDITCKVQGAIFNFGMISWPIWMLIESIQVFRMLVLKTFDQNPRAIHGVMAFVGFGVPAGIASIIACLDATVPGTLWCMLDNRRWGFVVQECCLLAASAISVGFCISIIVNLVKVEHKVHDELKKAAAEEDSASTEFNVVLGVELRLAVFVFLTLCVHLAFTVLGVLAYLDDTVNDEQRWIAQSIFFHVWILLHIILYGVRQEPFGAAKKKILTVYIRYTVKAPHPDPDADPEKGSQPTDEAPGPSVLKRQ